MSAQQPVIADIVTWYVCGVCRGVPTPYTNDEETGSLK